MSGVPSLETVGVTSFAHALESLLISAPSNPTARLYFFHLTQAVLRVISLQKGVFEELCSGELAPQFSSTLLSLTKLRNFSFGMSAREVFCNQNVVHGLLLRLCAETLPMHKLLESSVAPGSLDASTPEAAVGTTSSEKKAGSEETPMIVQNLEQMVE